MELEPVQTTRPLFSILDGLHLDTERRFWIEYRVTEGNHIDIQVDIGQKSIGVEIVLQISHNILISVEEYTQ
jgi:hypothetical protein